MENVDGRTDIQTEKPWGLVSQEIAKRWGVLFTNLVTRAVHLDLVPTLSSDDFYW